MTNNGDENAGGVIAIPVDEITADEINRSILRRLEKDDPELVELWIDHRDRSEYEVEGNDEVGKYQYQDIFELNLVGYLIGRCTHLEFLSLRGGYFLITHLRPFYRELARNRSIGTIRIASHDLEEMWHDYFQMLTPFLENNHSLYRITLDRCVLGDEGCQFLSSTLNRANKSLRHIEIMSCEITDEQSVGIIASMEAHPRLRSIDLYSNDIGAAGCNQLASIIQNSVTRLEHLKLCFNPIGYEGIQALAAALRTSTHLKSLHLVDSFIGSVGIECLADALKECRSFRELLIGDPITTDREIRALTRFVDISFAPNAAIQTICLDAANSSPDIHDKLARAFVNALVNNETLEKLIITGKKPLKCSKSSWKAISNLLCDKASVNATYYSNHTLEYIAPCTEELQFLFELNQSKNVSWRTVAMTKILHSHADIQMEPFFQWNFKMLPYAMDWLEKATTLQARYPWVIEEDLSTRKLSTIYQFIRGMPNEYIKACSKHASPWKKRLRSGKSKVIVDYS